MLAFVLSGGGSRGALQVGALKVLIEAGIRPDMVVGTSIGSVNATFLAADPTIAGIEKLEAIWHELENTVIFPGGKGVALLRFIRGRPSLYLNDRVHEILMQHLPSSRFEELALPCYAIAIDLDSGEIVGFGDQQEDLLEDGLMSSMALVPAYPPWRVGERRFIDGGFGAVLPVRQAIERGATQIIALHLRTPLLPSESVQSAFEVMTQAADLLARQQTATDIAYAMDQVELFTIDLYSDAHIPLDDFSRTISRIAKGQEVAMSALANNKAIAQLRSEQVA